jgi:hypothetical protein
MTSDETTALLEQLQQQWNILELLHFNEISIADQLQHYPYTIMQYQNQFIKEKTRLNELLEVKERVIGKLYDKLRFHNDKALTNKEIEQYYIPNDKDVIKVNNAISKQSIRVEFFEVCIKALDKMQWSMKLWIDEKKLGGY